MDKLQECAKAFEKLTDKKYHIIIGKKGKSVAKGEYGTLRCFYSPFEITA